MTDDYRPRITRETHNRLKRYYINSSSYSEYYEYFIKITFKEDGSDKKPWFDRIEQFGDNKEITTEEALNEILVSCLDEEGNLKAGARQLYERNNSIGE